jgi:hypothetical protein
METNIGSASSIGFQKEMLAVQDHSSGIQQALLNLIYMGGG